MPAMRNTTPIRTPTATMDVLLRRRTSHPSSSHAMPPSKKTHQNRAVSCTNVRFSGSIVPSCRESFDGPYVLRRNESTVEVSSPETLQAAESRRSPGAWRSSHSSHVVSPSRAPADVFPSSAARFTGAGRGKVPDAAPKRPCRQEPPHRLAQREDLRAREVLKAATPAVEHLVGHEPGEVVRVARLYAHVRRKHQLRTARHRPEHPVEQPVEGRCARDR